MASDFEIWAMRGLVGLLGTGLLIFVGRELSQKDAIWRTVTKNREAHEQALADARKEFTESLDRIAGQFRSAIDAINTTLSGLAVTMGKLDATMAREYASKADLKEVRDDLYTDLASAKADLQDTMDRHFEMCPVKLGSARDHR